MPAISGTNTLKPAGKKISARFGRPEVWLAAAVDYPLEALMAEGLVHYSAPSQAQLAHRSARYQMAQGRQSDRSRPYRCLEAIKPRLH